MFGFRKTSSTDSAGSVNQSGQSGVEAILPSNIDAIPQNFPNNQQYVQKAEGQVQRMPQMQLGVPLNERGQGYGYSQMPQDYDQYQQGGYYQQQQVQDRVNSSYTSPTPPPVKQSVLDDIRQKLASPSTNEDFVSTGNSMNREGADDDDAYEGDEDENDGDTEYDEDSDGLDEDYEEEEGIDIDEENSEEEDRMDGDYTLGESKDGMASQAVAQTAAAASSIKQNPLVPKFDNFSTNKLDKDSLPSKGSDVQMVNPGISTNKVTQSKSTTQGYGTVSSYGSVHLGEMVKAAIRQEVSSIVGSMFGSSNGVIGDFVRQEVRKISFANLPALVHKITEEEVRSIIHEMVVGELNNK